MADMKKKATKAPATITWRCPQCKAEVEHLDNVVTHSHDCKGTTVQLERIG